MSICPNKDTCPARDLCKVHTVEHESGKNCKASSYCPECVDKEKEVSQMPKLKCKCGNSYEITSIDYYDNTVYKEENRRCAACGEIMVIVGRKKKGPIKK